MTGTRMTSTPMTHKPQLNPALKLTDLQKADHIDPAHFAHLVPTYEALTQRCNQLLR